MESEFIAWLRKRLPPHPQLFLGPGDDAAILQLGRDARCIVTVDMLNDEVDFCLSEIDPRRAGRKALAVNLSDLAAMAAKPLAAVVALALPRIGGGELAVALYEGMIPLAEQYGVAIAGGDTNSWDGPLAIAITAIGEPTPRGSWLRSGAQPGDKILVTGSFGGSIHGKHLDFEPRVNEALLLNDHYEIHAAIDCSDGLSLDLSRLAKESTVGAVVDFSAIPIASAASGGSHAPSALEHALSDGEDFELILAVPPDVATQIIAEQPLPGVPVTVIGEFIETPGLWQADSADSRSPLVPRGFEHGFS